MGLGHPLLAARNVIGAGLGHEVGVTIEPE
jgi:hypothetical protein